MKACYCGHPKNAHLRRKGGCQWRVCPNGCQKPEATCSDEKPCYCTRYDFRETQS